MKVKQIVFTKKDTAELLNVEISDTLSPDEVLVKTAFSTIMLIKFIEFWNDYQTPLLYAPSHPTLAYGVWYMSNNREVVGMNNAIMRVTSSMILLIPILIVFILLRKKLMGNITVGGIKG